MAMITQVEDYFSSGCGRCERFATPDCSTQQWTKGLSDLRRICLSAGLEEAVKWAHPCYMHAGRNIALISALRGDFRLLFMNASLLKDPHSLLEKQGPNTRHPDAIRFISNDGPMAIKALILDYLMEAKGYVDAGLKPVREPQALDLPGELVEAMDSDPALAEAFHELTPGRQRSYVINLNGAKTAATRIARIAKFRSHIIAGKGAMER